MNKGDKIFVAGHTGLVGSAIMRLLQKEGYTNIITATKEELDLRDQRAVEWFFLTQKPDYVFNASGKVGGIMANSTYPAEFSYDNLAMEINLIHASHMVGVKKFLYLGSSCIYPRNCPQPIKEEYLMDGLLEPTNAPYAVAKIAGISMAQAYAKQYGMNIISLMPTNLYGPGDNYDPENSHVIPGLIRKFHDAKVNKTKVTLWGNGSALREFLFVDDLADACLFLMQNYDSPEIINVGSGEEVSILQLAKLIKEVVGFHGKIHWDTTKPNGTPRKFLNSFKLKSRGWKPLMSLEEGLQITYKAYEAN